jgi:hypothetical protein
MTARSVLLMQEKPTENDEAPAVAISSPNEFVTISDSNEIVWTADRDNRRGRFVRA